MQRKEKNNAQMPQKINPFGMRASNALYRGAAPVSTQRSLGGPNMISSAAHGKPNSLFSGKQQSRVTRSQITQQFTNVVEDDSFPKKNTELPSLATPFSQWSSFYSDHTADELFATMHAVVKGQADIDVEVHDRSYKLRGRKFIDHEMCEFQIEMYRVPTTDVTYPDHILVEFQRRSGDGMVFQNFLVDAFYKLHKQGMITFSHCSVGSHCHLKPAPLQFNPMGLQPSAQPQTGGGSKNSRRRKKKQLQKKATEQRMKENNLIMYDDDDDSTTDNSDDNTHHFSESDLQPTRMFIEALVSGYRETKRSAATYLARHCHDKMVVEQLLAVQPDLIRKLGEVLLKCYDPQVIRAVGVALITLLQNYSTLREQAQNMGLHKICARVCKRWSADEVRFGNSKNVIRVIPSRQVAEKMQMCISVLQ